MGSGFLRPFLQSLCCNSPWNYAVFWKLEHHDEMYVNSWPLIFWFVLLHHSIFYLEWKFFFLQDFGLERWLLWYSKVKRCHGELSRRFLLQQLKYDFVIGSYAKSDWWNSWQLSNWICCCWNVAFFSCSGERVTLSLILLARNLWFFQFLETYY